MVPKSFIQQLVSRSDVLEALRPTVKLEKRGSNWFGLCPFHNEKTPSFSVNPDKGYYHCFGCGAHGTALDYMVHLNGGDFISGVEALAAMLGMPVPKTKNDNQLPDPTQALKKIGTHWHATLQKNKPVQDYLTKRGVQAAAVKTFLLGYANEQWGEVAEILPKEDKTMLKSVGLIAEKNGRQFDYFRHRLMVPIMDQRGRMVGFGGRSLDNSEPKYLNSPDNPYFSKRRLLFGMPQAMETARRQDRLIICEGYMDVIMLHQHGFAESVATMGTAATAEQMQKATQLVNNIFFAYDGDAAGQKGAQRALENILPSLKDGVSVSFIFLPDGHDPDSYIQKLGAAAFEQLIKGATSLADYLISYLDKAQQGSTTIEGKKSQVMKEVERLLRLVSSDKAAHLKQLVLQKLSAYTGVDSQHLKTTRPKKTTPTHKHSFKMRPTDKLFVLLYSLEAKPSLVEQIPSGLPLPGGEIEVTLVDDILNKLRWSMAEEEKTVADILGDLGYEQLAVQVKARLHWLFSRPEKIEIEQDFEIILRNIKKQHQQLSQKGKLDWLQRIEEQQAT